MGNARFALRSSTLWAAMTALMVASPVTAQDHGQAADSDQLVTLDDHGVTVRSPDDRVNFRLGGRLHVDAGTGDTSAPVDIFPKHIDIRRGRIEPTLTIDKVWLFNLQYDFRQIDGSDPINNLLVSYKGIDPLTFTVGNMKEPFTLDLLTSNNDTTFMERSLASAFDPGPAGYNTGAAVGAHGENWTLSAGIYGGNLNDTFTQDGIEGAARGTYAPILGDHEVLHFGISGTYRSFGDKSSASFDTSPESFLFDASLVDTGGIDGANATSRLGFEAAWASGPFRVQAEYLALEVNRDGAPDVFFQAGYVLGSWVLNGNAAPYVLKSDTATEIGVFKRVDPGNQRVSYGGIGVFEVAGRYSVIDLADRDIEGGFEQDVTVGLNWYPEPYARLMLNYIHAWADPTADSVSGTDAEADIFQLRMQLAF